MHQDHQTTCFSQVLLVLMVVFDFLHEMLQPPPRAYVLILDLLCVAVEKRLAGLQRRYHSCWQNHLRYNPLPRLILLPLPRHGQPPISELLLSSGSPSYVWGLKWRQNRNSIYKTKKTFFFLPLRISFFFATGEKRHAQNIHNYIVTLTFNVPHFPYGELVLVKIGAVLLRRCFKCYSLLTYFDPPIWYYNFFSIFLNAHNNCKNHRLRKRNTWHNMKRQGKLDKIQCWWPFKSLI